MPPCQLVYLVGLFQSTSLVRGTTDSYVPFDTGTIFQSTSLVRGTTHSFCFMYDFPLISIHVPRERDDHFSPFILYAAHISIHVPRERDDQNTYQH